MAITVTGEGGTDLPPLVEVKATGFFAYSTPNEDGTAMVVKEAIPGDTVTTTEGAAANLVAAGVATMGKPKKAPANKAEDAPENK